jgi:hypothetical protein
MTGFRQECKFRVIYTREERDGDGGGRGRITSHPGKRKSSVTKTVVHQLSRLTVGVRGVPCQLDYEGTYFERIIV